MVRTFYLFRIASGQEVDVILLQCNGAFQTGHERCRAGKFHLCLLVGCFRSQTTVETQACQPYSLFAGVQRLLHDFQFVVECHQLEISLCHLCHKGHLQGTAVFHRLQKLGHAFVFGPSQVAPQIHFPGSYQFARKFGRRLVVISSIVFGILVGIQLDTHIGEQVGNGNAFLGCHFLEACRSRKHVLVILKCLPYELL